MHSPHITRIFTIAVLLIAVLCIATSVVAWWLRPPSFSTRSEAIIYTLKQHGYQVDQLYIDRRWPDNVNSQVYGASLDLQLHNRGSIAGRIECRTMHNSCWISFAKLGLDREPIPDVTISSEPDFLQWLSKYLKL